MRKQVTRMAVNFSVQRAAMRLRPATMHTEPYKSSRRSGYTKNPNVPRRKDVMLTPISPKTYRPTVAMTSRMTLKMRNVMPNVSLVITPLPRS